MLEKGRLEMKQSGSSIENAERQTYLNAGSSSSSLPLALGEKLLGQGRLRNHRADKKLLNFYDFLGLEVCARTTSARQRAGRRSETMFHSHC